MKKDISLWPHPLPLALAKGMYSHLNKHIKGFGARLVIARVTDRC